MTEKAEKKINIEEKDEKKNKLESIMDISNELQTSHKYHGDEDILITSGLNSNNIKKDLLLFKNDLLKDLKRQQAKIFEKTENNENYALDKIEEFNLKLEKYGEKIISLSNMIITDKTIREKVEELLEYKTKNQEMMMTNGIKIDNLDKDLFNNVYRIDNVLKETVMYPGVIGGICKFKTFHDFMDYVLSECSQNITFRDKTALDINNLRNNNERIINNFTNKLEKAKKALTLYVDTCIKKFENKIKDINDSFNDRITNYRIENMTYSENMKKASENLLKQVNSVIQAKNDIFNKFDEKMNLINKENSRMIKYFTGYKNEFNEMRRIFKEMIEALTKKDFSGMNRKINKLQRRSTMMNNDFKIYEDNLNNILHPISMNDMFMSEKNNKPKFSLKNNNLLREREKSNPYQLFLKEYKKIDSETKRISRFFEKENNFIERKKTENIDLKLTKRKKHHKKEKPLNDVYIAYKYPFSFEFIKRKLNKFNSVCVPNKKFNIDILRKMNYITKENLRKSRTIKITENNKTANNNINNKKNRIIKSRNIISDDLVNTSVSKSENSLFTDSSNISEQDEIKKNKIKTKYKTSIVINEKKELNLSNASNEKGNNEPYQFEINKKDFQEDKDYSQSIENYQTKNIKLDKYKITYDNNKTKPEAKNKTKIEINKDINNSLKKIYITLEGSNQLEINPNSKKNDPTQKNIVNNVKTIMNNKMGKTLSGYPKIVTNNGEHIIYSSKPIFKKQKFSSYTNPNLLALNYSINTLYENSNSNRGSSFQNNPLLTKMKTSIYDKNDKKKKVSFNIFKSLNTVNNFYFSQKKAKEEDKY